MESSTSFVETPSQEAKGLYNTMIGYGQKLIAYGKNPDKISDSLATLLTPKAHFYYGIHKACMTTLQKNRDRDSATASVLSKWRFEAKVLTLYLQHAKDLHGHTGRIGTALGDFVSSIPFRISYIQGEDIISNRKIERSNLSEMLILGSSVGAIAWCYFALMKNLEIVAILTIWNKSTFALSQVLKQSQLKIAKNNHSSNNPNESLTHHDTIP